ncbi:response regulator [Xanthomonas theicola]|uniref:response regulator n=1 Tax=Xanthomonas theicola TaxID=56464 RepID=UPI001FE9533B|nr:response regulator [Xanthomonas theicola]
MGGRIQVDSRPGHGACFRAAAAARWQPPPAEPASALPLAQRAQAQAQAQAQARRRILLVEDEPTVAKVMAELLRSRGHQSGLRRAGLEALTEATQSTFDLGLLDLDLPALDGLALARQLRALG